MALQAAARLALCFFIIACLSSGTLAQIPMDCCLSVRNQTIVKWKIVDYSLQTAGQGCSIDATILVTRGARALCVPADEPWVHAVISHVDDIKRRCKKNHKNKRWAKKRCR